VIVRKNLKWAKVFRLSFGRLIYFFTIAVSVYVLHEIYGFNYVTIPFAIVATLATALAIFLAFRNDSSYDRWWEARKIWGEIVNSSRTWGRQATTFMDGADEKFVQSLVYRQLAWINAVRLQLRKQEDWQDLDPFLSNEEKALLMAKQNKATQLNLKQGEAISTALKNGWISDFRHQLLDKTLTDLIAFQGKCERIKTTPMARQYDYFTRFFVFVFATLLPFGMIDLLDAKHIAWVVIPLSLLISFCFSVLESVGAYNEDPFENREQDTPMTALCRTIEIDLREQLGETELPKKVEPVEGILY
jgi:ion channel-forming bestrophin family protein